MDNEKEEDGGERSITTAAVNTQTIFCEVSIERDAVVSGATFENNIAIYRLQLHPFFFYYYS